MRLLRFGGANVVGEAGPFEKVAAVAVLGAVRRPASRWDRLVRGVGAPLSISCVLAVSNERGLMLFPPRREARPEEGMARPCIELKEE